MNRRVLFVEGDLSATLNSLLRTARGAVDAVPEAEFRSSDPSGIAEQLFERFRVAPVMLTEGAVSVQAEDAEIDRRAIPNIDWGLPGAPPTVPGTRVIYNVPFTGDAGLFRLKPSTWTTSAPHAAVVGNDLRFAYDVQSSQVAATKSSFERDLKLTKQWLAWGADQVAQFNEELARTIESGVNARAARHAAATEGLAALGLPVQEPPRARIDVTRVRTNSAQSPTVSASTVHEFDVALSFAGEDRTYVHEVATCLKRGGAKVFYDEFETANLWGKDLVEHLQDIYQNRARFCVLFISEHYISKPWPRHERRSAQARALLAKDEYLLPARFDESVLPGLPPTVGYIDLRRLTPNECADLILAKIGKS